MSTKKLQIIGSFPGVGGGGEGGSVEIDKTLSHSGKAADAKATGDAINNALNNSVADWDQVDETAVNYIKNKPDIAQDMEVLALLSEKSFVTPIVDAADYMYLDSDESILIM